MKVWEEDEADIATEVGVKTAALGDDAAVEAWKDGATGETEPCIGTAFCGGNVDCGRPREAIDSKEAFQPDA